MLRRFIDAGYVDCFRQANGSRPGFTYPAAAPWLRLDYALATPALAAQLVSCDVYAEEPAATASDHLPLVTVFR